MKHIVITGFQPFAKYRRNTSGEILSEILRRDRHQLFYSLQLPTAYEKSFELLKNKLLKHNLKADWIFCLGIHKGEDIRLEKVALNYNDGIIPDIDDCIFQDKIIDPQAPSCYINTINLKKYLSRSGKWQVVESLSAGSYVCNDLYFRLMDFLHRKRQKNLAQNALFIHIPQVPREQHESLGITLYNLMIKIAGNE